MALVNLTKETFNDHITNNRIVIVDVWADGCGPCKAFAPTFEAAADKFPDISFAKINVYEGANKDIAREYGLRSVPTIMVFRDQSILYSRAGVLNAAALDDLVKLAQDVNSGTQLPEAV